MDFLIIATFSPFIIYLISLLHKIASKRRDQHCYLIHYEPHKPSDDRKLGIKFSGDMILQRKNLGIEEHKFALKAIVSSGIGGETYVPRNIIESREDDATLQDGLAELDEFFENSLSKLFNKTGISPQEIDILVVNVALFSPVQSFSSRIINRYKMRHDVKTFNLSGMGCSASLISLNVVENIFKVYKNVNALIVTSESIALNFYKGIDKSMILSNCLFRSGGCSMLLTNNRAMRSRAKLRLKCLVRTHLGSIDEAHTACMQKEDDEGHLGVFLSKNLPRIATLAFTKNITHLAPKVVPLKELVRYVVSIGLKINPNLNLKSGIDHFCVHPGGKAVIEQVRMKLGLSDKDVEASKMTLHRFGNTSASSLWYVLAYMEAKKWLKKGETIWMISFGSGFKCNSCVWEVVGDLEDGNVWGDKIDNYPPKILVNPYMEQYGWVFEANSKPLVAEYEKKCKKLAFPKKWSISD